MLEILSEVEELEWEWEWELERASMRVIFDVVFIGDSSSGEETEEILSLVEAVVRRVEEPGEEGGPELSACSIRDSMRAFSFKAFRLVIAFQYF